MYPTYFLIQNLFWPTIFTDQTYFKPQFCQAQNLFGYKCLKTFWTQRFLDKILILDLHYFWTQFFIFYFTLFYFVLFFVCRVTPQLKNIGNMYQGGCLGVCIRPIFHSFPLKKNTWFFFKILASIKERKEILEPRKMKVTPVIHYNTRFLLENFFLQPKIRYFQKSRAQYFQFWLSYAILS